MAYRLVAAQNGKLYQQGQTVWEKSRAVFGRKERLPQWLRVRVPDGSGPLTKKQFDKALKDGLERETQNKLVDPLPSDFIHSEVL